MDIFYRKAFLKIAKKLPKYIEAKFDARVDILRQDRFNPILNNHSVDPPYKNCRSINVTGDYRAIFHQEGNSATFIAIGTHAQLYKSI
jgi:mRNA-degrading endonuclease YafQ of YafQ-DinJ toxin-antitoxin module